MIMLKTWTKGQSWRIGHLKWCLQRCYYQILCFTHSNRDKSWKIETSAVLTVLRNLTSRNYLRGLVLQPPTLTYCQKQQKNPRGPPYHILRVGWWSSPALKWTLRELPNKTWISLSSWFWFLRGETWTTHPLQSCRDTPLEYKNAHNIYS